MSRSTHGQRHHRHRSAPRRSPRRAARFGRASAASAVGLLGLAVIVLGPAAVAIGWHTHHQIRLAHETARNPLGTTVTDGPATFFVEEVRCGADDGTVHGQRCLVEITASNDGDDPLAIPGMAQVLIGPEGVRYLPDGAAAEPFGTLPPGGSATAIIAYDLPPHARITHVGVHADPYSDGKRVWLAGTPQPLHPPAG
jgi:hypothetical protein